jgi:hypothetical protein
MILRLSDYAEIEKATGGGCALVALKLAESGCGWFSFPCARWVR